MSAKAEIPTCLWCEAKLKSNATYSEIRGKRVYGYDGNGFFCSLRHGFLWGVEVAKINRANGII